ncbi:putative leader peptide [Streptomyces rishiriensis]|uniref:putative leader peptide n=1 Tax=Streptomyces rishiriensis TaxID=68264 RepID=UPI0037D98AB5
MSRSASPCAVVRSSHSYGGPKPPYWKKRHSRAVVLVEGDDSEVGRVTRAPRAVRLHSRPHIDLQRVAGALCRS